MSEADIPPRTCLPLSITWGESFHAKGTPFPKGSLRGGEGILRRSPWDLRGGEESLGYLDRFLQKGGIPDL